MSASASSGLAVAFSSGSPSVCTVTGSSVSMTGVGTCVIDADQAGNSTYQAAAQVQQSFAVGRGSQTITFTSTAPARVDPTDPPYTVTATSSSGLPVTFSVDASSSGICSVSGNTVSFVSRGTCIVYANQAGNASWLAAPQVQQVIDVKNHTPG